jgi:hypothetical protein
MGSLLPIITIYTTKPIIPNLARGLGQHQLRTISCKTCGHKKQNPFDVSLGPQNNGIDMAGASKHLALSSSTSQGAMARQNVSMMVRTPNVHTIPTYYRLLRCYCVFPEFRPWSISPWASLPVTRSHQETVSCFQGFRKAPRNHVVRCGNHFVPALGYGTVDVDVRDSEKGTDKASHELGTLRIVQIS